MPHPLPHSLLVPELMRRVLGRDQSLFHDAIALARPILEAQITGARVLVIGAAGSIGASVVHALLPFLPKSTDLIDTNENGLVELVRSCHASGHPLPQDSFIGALDFDNPEFHAWLRTCPRHDFVLNFAALKHVRSESDPYTAMRMLRINASAHRPLGQVLGRRPPKRYFVVSSDKAVRPANLLGATKAFMERICLDGNDQVPFSSARFANVAFSQGSLLDGFLHRISLDQPLAGPTNVERYFISSHEAADLCLLGCFCAPSGSILTPIPGEALHLQAFPEIAQIILNTLGLTADPCASAEEAVHRAKLRRADDPRWPCYFAPSTTTGEKEKEEFVGAGEVADHDLLPGTSVILQPTRASRYSLKQAESEIDQLVRAGAWTKPDILRIVASVVPDLGHHETYTNLHAQL